MDALIDRTVAASEAIDVADRAAVLALPADRARQRRAFRAARNEYRAALDAIRRAIAQERGWRVARTPFRLRDLIRRMDPDNAAMRYERHLDCFRGSERPCKAVAAISHC